MTLQSDSRESVPSHIFFDMDGTLADPREGFVNCVQHGILSLGSEPRDSSELCKFIGPSLDYTFRALRPNANESQIAFAISKYRERFASQGAFESTLYPGISETLASLANSGASLFVVTMRARVFAQQVLEHLKLNQYFRAVYGPELTDASPKKTNLIRQALEAESLNCKDVVMVGDRAEDVLAARENGLRVVFVTWGYGSPAEMEASRPDKIANSISELVSLLQAPQSQWS